MTAHHQLLLEVCDLSYDLLCKKCNSRIFVDNVFSTRDTLELYCMGCGYRCFVPSNNPLGRVLLSINNERAKIVAVM